MNYYEHHIGDYAEATAHLSFVEDAAYSRLIRKYYAQEKPLPAELKAVQRLVGARTKEEREAVETILEEFFSLQDDGWHQLRCDAEIARYQEKQRKAKASADARWSMSKPQSERNANAMRTHVEKDANALPTQCEGNAHQAPSTKHQSPDLKPKANTATPHLTEVGAKKADGAGWTPGEISFAMKSAGVQSQPADPRIIALAEQGISPETVAAACAEAKASKPNENIKPGYVVAIINRWAKEAASLQATGARAPSSSNSSKDASRAAAAASIGLGGQKNDIELNTIDGQFRALD